MTKRLILAARRALFALWALGAGGAGADTPVQPAAAENPRFDVYEYRVEGNSVLDNRAIEKTLYGYLGPGKTIADVEQAQQALEKLYHDAGYGTVRVDIPEQDVLEGLVTLAVVEAKIESTQITGSRYYSLGHIRSAVPALAEGTVPHLPTIQSQLEQLNKETGDRTVTPIARAGRTPGTTEWELQVQDKLPLHGSVEMNSRNTPGTTYTRLSASLRYDNLWQKFHSVSLQYQVTPENPDQVEVYSGTYVMPVFDTGWRLAFYGVGTSSNTGAAVLGGSTILGSAEIFGLRAIRLLPEMSNYFHTLTLGFDHKSFGQSVFSTVDTQSSPAEYSPFTARYDGTWRHEDGSVSLFGLEGNVLFRGLGNEQDQFTAKRSGSQTNYAYFGLDLEHRQALPQEARLVARASGQISDYRLISNEQFVAGGQKSVRGYHEVEILGDNGVSGSLELYSPPLIPGGWDFAQEFRVLAFLDGAKIWINDALPDVPKSQDIASSGLGLKWQVLSYLVGEFYWAYPFIRTDHVNPGNQRVDFRMAMEF